MKLSAQWIRDFVDLTVDNARLAEALTNVGISVEGISGSGADTVFEMEIGTNRPDAMNHYGAAGEAAAIVVCDAKKPVGLAGVMGGYETMITDKTRNIVIESAWWDPGIVRKMSRRHGVHTDASHRFERGADFESTVLSCDLVAQMILESGGGELIGDAIDVVSRPLDLAPVLLRISEVHRILGGNLDAGQVFRLLKSLGFILIPEGQQNAEFRVTIPSWRLDVEREIDVIEEIARLHGYDKFESTLPAYSGAVMELPNAKVDRALRTRALALGYNEAVSLTFISHEDAEKFATVTSSGKVLELENPLSEEASVMRTPPAPVMVK